MLRRPTPLLATLAVVLGLLTVPAAAQAAPDQEIPFGCGETWVGTTRAAHRPSRLSIDFNRPGDRGRIVVASATGVVTKVGDAGNRSYGRWVQIAHPEGHSTVYAHLLVQWVVPGQFVDQGAPIGRVGDTGGVSGAHLHYEQRLGSTVRSPYFGGTPFVFGRAAASGNCPDVPLSGDWDGDATEQVGVFRRDAGAGTFEMHAEGTAPSTLRFGLATDQPVTGDWDGDGVTDVGVRRTPARAFLLRTADGQVTRRRYGLVKDIAVTGDWDGDRITDLGLWRPRAGLFLLLMPDGTQQRIRLGSGSSQPVTGDWDGDGRTDVGVFDAAAATFRLRTVSAAGVVTVTSVPLGSATDLAVAGDWNGDGAADVGTWAPGTATFTLRVAAKLPLARRRAAEPELRTLAFGRPR